MGGSEEWVFIVLTLFAEGLDQFGRMPNGARKMRALPFVDWCGHAVLAEEFWDGAGAVAELVEGEAGFFHEGEPVVGEGGVFFGEDEVAAVLDVFGSAAGEEGGEVFEFMAAAEVGSVADDAVVVEA